MRIATFPRGNITKVAPMSTRVVRPAMRQARVLRRRQVTPGRHAVFLTKVAIRVDMEPMTARFQITHIRFDDHDATRARTLGCPELRRKSDRASGAIAGRRDQLAS